MILIITVVGFFIYEEMKSRLSQSGYYGIPRNMDYDGLNSLGQLCTVLDRSRDNGGHCVPMEKVFYLQYQYMPFFVAALSVFFYAPYLAFGFTNSDLVQLKEYCDTDEVTSDKLLKKFFDLKKNKARKMRYRVVTLLLVKIMYLLVNVLVMMACNEVLAKNFLHYGSDYLSWSELDNAEAHDHNLRVREQPKPANVLLPPLGLCEIHEATRDVRNTRVNIYKFICEISPHVFYQYVMLILWFCLVFGMIISSLGIVANLFGHLMNFACFMSSSDPARRMYRVITLREIDYLEYVRRSNMPVYVELLRKIRISRAAEFDALSSSQKGGAGGLSDMNEKYGGFQMNNGNFELPRR